MSDYIFFYQNHNDVSIFAADLVAFFPDDGFMIFEGYNHMRNNISFPYTIELLRHEPRFCAYYKLNITDGYKKHIQSPPREKPVISDPDDNEDCIQFFSRDMIILKFTLKEVSSNAPDGYDWRYCVDHRFETPEELLTMYTSLVDLPEKSWELVKNPEHEPFYKGYHKMRNEMIDIFRADRELPRFTQQHPTQKHRILFKE